jgi:hypothetical protein
MTKSSDSKSIVTLTITVFFANIIVILFGYLFITLFLGLVSGWKTNPVNALPSGDIYLDLLLMLLISSFFTAFDVKGLGPYAWIVYFLLIFVRLLYLTNYAEWAKIPVFIQSTWTNFLFLHPIIYFLLGGRMARYISMTPNERKAEDIIATKERDRKRTHFENYQYHEYQREYDRLSEYEKDNLRYRGIDNSIDYANRKKPG